ncbi:uncharacterized protein TNCV_661301 [Trichonephila clavipes]|nr:uncharacterized protein TNCV_661301 [Trichonephila clavipes]
MDFTEINSRGKQGELLGRIDRQNSRFRTAKTIIIKFGLHASSVESESAKNALNEQFLVDKRINVLKPPPYSPDLLPYDFYRFLKVKNALMGIHFQSVEELKAKSADLLNMVTPNEQHHCFERWETRMQLYIDKGAEHVEGD